MEGWHRPSGAAWGPSQRMQSSPPGAASGDRWGQGSVLSSLRDAKENSPSLSAMLSLPEP